MKLSEAYEKLQWGSPVVFERAGIRTAAAHGHEPVSIGTSAHMLIELYLDMDRSLREGGSMVPPADFLVVCKDIDTGKYLRRWLTKIHGILRLDVDPKRVHFFPHTDSTERLRGTVWYSWAVFCDHEIKEFHGHERNMGPYRFVRSVEPFDDVWVARDRDGRRLCHLTSDGMDELAKATTMPYTILHDDLVNTEVTYPAPEHEELNQLIRLRRSFER
jgi:hypothetical protein